MRRHDTKPRRIFNHPSTPLRRRVLLIATFSAPYLLRATPTAADAVTLRIRPWKLLHANATRDEA
ncbi:MAG TPA: hypothetical protein VGG99_03045 [Acetobacteraceae bacterium]